MTWRVALAMLAAFTGGFIAGVVLAAAATVLSWIVAPAW